MQKTKPTSVDDYIAAQPAASQAVLSGVRGIVRKTIPDAMETISYGIPTYKLQGRPVIYFAGWKEHYSLYPANDRLVQTFKEELEGYERSKGTIRFPLAEPVPVKLIEGIVRFRKRETLESIKPSAGVGSIKTESRPARKAVRRRVRRH